MHVIVPTRVGPLAWVATDEDKARARAEALARRLERAPLLIGLTAQAADSDPLVAIRDALLDFQADTILLLGQTHPEIDDPLEELGLTVTRIPQPTGTRRHPVRAFVHSLRSGRNPATPFIALAAANLALIATTAALTLLALLIIWLLS